MSSTAQGAKMSASTAGTDPSMGSWGSDTSLLPTTSPKVAESLEPPLFPSPQGISAPNKYLPGLCSAVCEEQGCRGAAPWPAHRLAGTLPQLQASSRAHILLTSVILLPSSSHSARWSWLPAPRRVCSLIARKNKVRARAGTTQRAGRCRGGGSTFSQGD